MGEWNDFGASEADKCVECGGGGYVPADAVTAHLRRPRVPCPSCTRKRHDDPITDGSPGVSS